MKKILMAGAAVMALSTAASASTFSIVGGSVGSIPGGKVNNVLVGVFGMPGTQGYYGSNIVLDSSADVKVEFIGFEASYVNSFSYAGGGFDTESVDGDGNNRENASGPTANIGEYTVLNALAGLLDFSFSTDSGTPVNTLDDVTVDNTPAGNNPDNSSVDPNFFASYGQGGARDTVYLWFDDGGAQNDDNHDDLVIRLTTRSGPPPAPNPVPLPAAGFLLLGALGGLGLAKRRK